jgi:hypothetical protein
VGMGLDLLVEEKRNSLKNFKTFAKTKSSTFAPLRETLTSVNKGETETNSV